MVITATNSITGTVYDISTLCARVIVTEELEDQAGKLDILMREDPNGVLQLINGGWISLEVNGVNIFYGRIQRIGMDSTYIYRIYAMDSKVNLQHVDVLITEGLTASQIFALMCQREGLNYTVKTSTRNIITTYLHDKKTRYSIIHRGIEETKRTEGLWCFIRDEAGTLVFTDVESERTDITIGDKSLLMDYKHEIAIDKDTTNLVRVVRNNPETGQRDNWVTMDSETIGVWGLKPKLIEADELDSEEQIKEFSRLYLQLKNRETRTLELNCLGDVRLRAGAGINVKIDRLDINEPMWITSVKHTFDNNQHICKMGVAII